jgi:hypothetical protein
MLGRFVIRDTICETPLSKPTAMGYRLMVLIQRFNMPFDDTKPKQEYIYPYKDADEALPREVSENRDQTKAAQLLVDNPWLDLPEEEPFVLESDKPNIADFNRAAGTDYLIHTELMPEPFLGNPQADIVLLNLNPGFNDRDPSFHHGDPYFIESLRGNLVHRDQKYPFFLLDPKNSASPGFGWWSQKLKPWIREFGLAAVASRVLCVEFFPYHSRKYKRMRSILPSQQYSFHLVKEAVKRNAAIIIMRQRKRWLEQIPWLAAYDYSILNSAQNCTISSNNLQRFDDITTKFSR